MSHLLIMVFLASLGLDWPVLPGNARLAEVLAVPAAAAVLTNRWWISRLHSLDWAVLAYLLASGVGALASNDVNRSGLELARHVYLAGLYAIVACAVRGGATVGVRNGLALMGIVLAVPSVLLALLFLIQPFTLPAAGEVMPLPYVGNVLRLRGFTASPTMFACVLTMALPFAMAGWQGAEDVRSKRWWAVAGAGLIAGAVWSFSHVWAGAALAVTIVAWPRLHSSPVLRSAAVVVVVALTLVFNATLIASVRGIDTADAQRVVSSEHPYAVDSGTYAIDGYVVDYSVMSYFRIKQLAWEAFLTHPVAGVGLDRFHDVTRAAYDAGRLPHLYREIDPHSALLGRLAETGIVGGVTLIVLWVAVLKSGVRVIRGEGGGSMLARAAIAGIAGLLLAGINVDIMNFRFVWAAFGIVRGLAEGDA